MLDKLIEIGVALRSYLAPFAVIDAFEGAGVLRLGNYHRTLGPGFHWKWPLLERVWEVTTCRTTLRLPPQTVTTKDRKTVVVSAIVAYEVKDVRPFITDIYDQKDVLADVTMGAVRRAVVGMELNDLLSNAPEEAVLRAVRDKVNQFGFKVHAVTFPDLAEVWSLRLIQSNGKDIDN